jgi:hypothetical protein
MKTFLAAALAFGALVLATPVVAYLLRHQLAGRGAGGLLTLLGVGLVMLGLCGVCLALFARAARHALQPPGSPLVHSASAPR